MPEIIVLESQAAAGELADLTGTDAPYEPPVDPELIVRTDEAPLTSIVDEIASTLLSA